MAMSSTGVESSSSRADRLLATIALLLIFIMAARTPIDTDMWWHLSAGSEGLARGAPLQEDVFSFTRPGADWVNVFWLFDLLMALFFRWFGYLGLGLLVAGLAVLSMAIVYKQSQGPVAVKVFALLLGSVVASPGWPPRPLLSSLVLLALTGYLVHLYKRRGVDRLWALPLVFILWSNLHGGYPLGLLYLIAVLAGEALNHLLKLPVENALPWPKILRLLLWTAACVPAVLINPQGINVWLLPLQTVNMAASKMYIAEWSSPDFHSLLEQSMMWMLLAIFAMAALSGRVMDGVDLLLAAGFAAMALVSRRNFGPFAVVAVPILARCADYTVDSLRERLPGLNRLIHWIRPGSEEPPRSVRRKRIANLLIAAVLGMVAVIKVYTVTYPVLVEAYIAAAYPTRAVAWLQENESTGRVFNEYEWGGFMQWRARQFPVFVDGRADLYGDALIEEWLTAISAAPGWQEILDRYEVSIVFIRPDRPLAAALAEAGWQLLYQDDQSVVFGRDGYRPR